MRVYKSYHEGVRVTALKEAVDRLTVAILNWRARNPLVDLTHIVVTGISGQSLAWPLSLAVGLPVMVVRRKGEDAHSGAIVGDGDLGNYIIVDDLISTGYTIRHIVSTIYETFAQPGGKGDLIPIPKAIFLSQVSYDGTQEANGHKIEVIGTREKGSL